MGSAGAGTDSGAHAFQSRRRLTIRATTSAIQLGEDTLRARELHEGIDVEPLTAIPASFPEQRARVLRVLIKWQGSVMPAGPPSAYQTSRATFHDLPSGAGSA
jgi:hypothetical protein